MCAINSAITSLFVMSQNLSHPFPPQETSVESLIGDLVCKYLKHVMAKLKSFY